LEGITRIFIIWDENYLWINLASSLAFTDKKIGQSHFIKKLRHIYKQASLCEVLFTILYRL